LTILRRFCTDSGRDSVPILTPELSQNRDSILTDPILFSILHSILHNQTVPPSKSPQESTILDVVPPLEEELDENQ
jgi:hypothetical protein